MSKFSTLAILAFTAVLSSVLTPWLGETRAASHLHQKSPSEESTMAQSDQSQPGAVSIPRLKALVERMGELNTAIRGGYYPKVRPLVSIEQFFNGSNGQASLWFNQYPEVDGDVDEVAFWKSLRDRPDVWDVLISVRQYDFGEQPFDPQGGWVVSDVVVIITSAKPDELIKSLPENAAPEFEADDWSGTGESHEKVFVPKGMKPLFFWYD